MPEACTSQNSQDFVGQVKSGKEDGPNEIGESSTDVCDKEEANRVIGSLPFRPWKNSKYVVGVKMTNYF